MFLRVVTRCRCDRPIPLAVSVVVKDALVHLPPETIVATYYCRRCGVNRVTLAEARWQQQDEAA